MPQPESFIATMKIHFPLSGIVLALLLVAAGASVAIASSVLPLSVANHLAASDAVFRGIAVGTDSFRNPVTGQIFTRTSLRVIEPFKGTFPTIVAIVNPGGSIGAETLYHGWSPKYKAGKEYLVYAVRRPDGRLTCTQGAASAIRLERDGGVLIPNQQSMMDELANLTNPVHPAGSDVTDQTGIVTTDLTTGLLDRGGGIAARFVQPDRGEPIPYLIDADSLPAGITLTQATNAVAQAMSAWTAVTSLKFKFQGLQSFGQAADTINAADEIIRIQLHDNYNSINSASTLGIGGQYTSASLLSGSGWGAGGNVASNEFFKSSCGFVVLEHSAASLQNLSNLTEVLCHEIGHVIGMAHSSESATEPNTTLKQSIMYYSIHGGNRGGTLGTYDPPVIQQAYPTNNTPPYSYSRVLDVTTDSPAQPNVAGINEVELRGYDLQNTSVTLLISNAANLNGTFVRSGNTVRYNANGFFGNSTRLDPAGNSYNDIVYARFSDGTNASAYISLRVVSFNSDTLPNPTGDGIPDNWMQTYFGNIAPTGNRAATADFDGDGLKNIDEYRAGMNPADPTSAQRITLFTKTNLEFQAKAYELYELQASTNLTSWIRAGNPVVPTNATGTFSDFPNTSPQMFFRVVKVP